MSDSGRDIEAWNRIAATYAGAVGTPDDRIFAHLREAMWASLAPLKRCDVLDLGCGHGWLSSLLVKAGARVLGVDGSSELLAVAKTRCPSAEFFQADFAQPIDVKGKTFDRVVANMVLMDLAEIGPVLQAVRATLRPNGRFVFTLPHPCFFSYRTCEDPVSGELACAVTQYLRPERWWIESYGGHAHYHRSLTFYFDQLRASDLVVSRLFEPPHLSKDPERSAFYEGIPKFMLIEARAASPSVVGSRDRSPAAAPK